MLSSLRKIKGRSFEEIRARGMSQVEALLEKIGVSSKGQLPTTADLLRQLGGRDVRDQSFLSDWLDSRRGLSFRSLSDPELTAHLYSERFPTEADSVISRADRICSGRFDLLGYRDLDFGGQIPSWHLDAVSGLEVPIEHWSEINFAAYSSSVDLKVIWELNRHQYFNTLGRAYVLTRDEKYAETFIRHIEDWLESNKPKRGINWSSSLEISFRSISWIWAMNLFRESPSLKPHHLLGMLKYLFLNARHIETYLSTYSSPNTHLTGEALGLYFIGNFFAGSDWGDRWENKGYRLLVGALEFQVRKDGSYCEQSSHYHRYTVDFYTNLVALRQSLGETIEPVVRESLEKLYEFLLYTSQPNGHISLFGDDDGGRLVFLDENELTDVRGTLAVGAAMLDRGDLKFAAEPSGELLWLLGPEGLDSFDRLSSIQPAYGSRAFYDGGAYVMRSGWERESTFLLVHCGEHGFLNGGHAHADALSFVMAAGGEEVFVDSGTFKYESEPEEREYFRSGAAHNCLLVNGESSSAGDGPWRWKRVADCRVIRWDDSGPLVRFRGKHDGFDGIGVKYEREIELRPGCGVSISDFMESRIDQHYELNFVLSDQLETFIEADKIRVLLSGSDKTLLTITTTLKGEHINGHRWTSFPCYISRAYGRKDLTTRLTLKLEASGSVCVTNKFSFPLNGVST
jgi:hypothetical protein